MGIHSFAVLREKKSTNKGHPRGTKGARCSAHACSREKVDLYVSY